MTIAFQIPMLPVPKQTKGIAAKGRGFVRHYTPAKVRSNADSLASLIAPYRPDKPLEGPVVAKFMFVFPWRKSETKKNRERKMMPRDTKPDLDNLEKQVCDVLESCGFIGNDSQIACKATSKWYGDSPKTAVVIIPMDEYVSSELMSASVELLDECRADFDRHAALED